MWQKVQFIVSNLPKIAAAGFVFWLLVILSLQMAGVMDIETRCPYCIRLMDKTIEHFISDANAATPDVVLSKQDTAPMTVTVTLLPKRL